MTKTPLEIIKISSYEQYKIYSESMMSEYLRRQDIELSLISSPDSFYTRGECYVCDKETNFYTDFMYSSAARDEKPIPNWRERLVCPGCGLNNRMRGAIQIFEQICKPQRTDPIYITEQVTPLFAWFNRNYKNVIGSEYLGDNVPYGSINQNGIRNQSITKLSFTDNQFCYILSFDVFEHVPDYKKAFLECFRCLRPKGLLLFTVPFVRNSNNNIVLARTRENGEVDHVFPPEYHGDPLDTKGCLCFYHFGWEVLTQLTEVGFSNASACLFWSAELGYLGGEQIVLVAHKE